MNISVTGATGYIGTHLCKRLVENGHKVTALVRDENKTQALKDMGVRIIECDITDKDGIAECLMNCDRLYHLANISRWWLRDKEDYINVNVDGTHNIFEAALKRGVKKVVFTSSVAAIRQPPGILSREELEHCGDFESIYGKSKYLAEQLALKFFRNQKLKIVIINPGVVFGPGDFKTFGKMLLDYLNGKLKFRAFDNSYVPLVYIDDVVNAHILAMEKGNPGEKYIVVGDNMRIIDIYRLAHQLTGKPIPRHRLPGFIIKIMAYLYELKAMLDGVPPRLAIDAVRAMQFGASASNEKSIRELGICYIPVDEAMRKTIKWYNENGYVNNQ